MQLTRLHLILINRASISSRSLKSKQFVQFAEATHANSKEASYKVEEHEATVNALLLAAECHLNPYFMATVVAMPNAATAETAVETTEEVNHEYVYLEEKRDSEVLQLLIKAAQWDAEQKGLPMEDEQTLEVRSKSIVNLLPTQITDWSSVDLITLVRVHERVLYAFLSSRLNNANTLLHEVLLQGLMYPDTNT